MTSKQLILRDKIKEEIEKCKAMMDSFSAMSTLPTSYSCPRLTVDVVESIIKSFPPTWNFEFDGFHFYTVVKSKTDKNKPPTTAIFIVGTHDFGRLSFKISDVDIVSSPNDVMLDSDFFSDMFERHPA